MGMTFAEICKMTDKDDELFEERIKQRFIDIVNKVNERDLATGTVFTLEEIGNVMEDESSTIDLSEEYYNENRESIFAVYEASMALLGSRILKEVSNCEDEEDINKINLNDVLEDFLKDLLIMTAIKNGNEEEGS